MSALLLTTPQFVLDKVEYFLRDNRRMAVLDIVLGDLSLIRLLFLLKEIYCERLLQQGIVRTRVPFGLILTNSLMLMPPLHLLACTLLHFICPALCP